jgi:hypothetical protein
MRIGNSHPSSDGINRVSFKKYFQDKSHLVIGHQQGKDGILTTANGICPKTLRSG